MVFTSSSTGEKLKDGEDMTSRTRPKRVKIESYICHNCGQKMYVPRIRSRERGHIKDMWCVRCEEITKFVKEEKFNADKFDDTDAANNEKESSANNQKENAGRQDQTDGDSEQTVPGV